MRISWHALAVSSYCSLMVTSGFTTIKLPVSLATPVAGAEAAATRQVQIGIQSLGFSAGAISLPSAPVAAVAQPETNGFASAVPDAEFQGWATWVQSNGNRARLPAPIAQRLGLSNDDMVLRSTKTVTGLLQRNIMVTDALGRPQLLFTVLNRTENKAIFYLVGVDGVLERALVAQNGNYWELSMEEGRRDVENERAFWRKQLAGIGNS